MPGEIFDHKYVYDEIGYNLKPIELQASMGLKQLEKLEVIGEFRRRNYQLLLNIYKKYEEFFHIPYARAKADVDWFAFPLTIKKDAPFKRSEIVDFLEENKIQTRPYFAGNIMLQPAYAQTNLIMNQDEVKNNYPVATHVTTHTFFHGTSPVITPTMIEYIGTIVDQFMAQYV